MFAFGSCPVAVKYSILCSRAGDKTEKNEMGWACGAYV